jgi:FlaA1/EpsC-like NDP-sugar epimerase
MPNLRIILAMTHDVLAVAVAWITAFWLRFNLDVPEPYSAIALFSLAWITPFYALLFLGSGLYRGIWRFASLPDLRRIIITVSIGALAAPAMLFMLQITVPRSVFILSPILLVMMMGGSRLAYRGWKERIASETNLVRKPVVILGATEAGASLARELSRSPQWKVVGIFDDDRANHRRQIHGAMVHGAIDDLRTFAPLLKIQHAIIALPEANHRARRKAVESARAAGLQVLTVPSFDDLISGRVTVSEIRKVELDDLLGRDPVQLDTRGLHEWLGNRVLLISGAGGSIGSELCRQVARYQPAHVILLESNEYSLYAIEQEFIQHLPNVKITPIIGDVKDAKRMTWIASNWKPHIVFHAAAYKHVPLMESDNAWQAVVNNVLGTYVLAQAALAHGAEKFIFISTDKAVNPTNVMGATKRLAELVCQSLQQPTGTRFLVVRFGNVLGSTGSVIPKFREQIARGGPVTVTHPDITRFFMSIPEAVQLVLQAGLIGKGGEIVLLDMGEPVKIADLAKDMIRLSGMDENDIKIVYTGLRPGEKLFEEVLAADENSLPTPHQKLRIAKARHGSPQLLTQLVEWLSRTDQPQEDIVKSELGKWVPEYMPR